MGNFTKAARKFEKIFIGYLFIVFAFIPAGSSGENFTYDGSTPSLQTAPNGVNDALLPTVDVDGNTVTVNMSGGATPNHVYGSFMQSGPATGNTVDFQQGAVHESVYGGLVWSYSGYAATDNQVKISSNATITANGSGNSWVYGGFSYGGDASKNGIIIDGGTIGGNGVSNNIFGGYTEDGNAIENTVEYKSGVIGLGGTSRIYGGYSLNGDAIENKAIMSGGSVNWLYGGRANTTGEAKGNIVQFSSGTVNNWINGGYSGEGSANDNEVEITGGSVTWTVVGGYSNGTGSADRNTVSVSSGNIGGNVLGGRVLTGSASTNMLVLTGGTISGANTMIAGGTVETTGNVFDNTVSISNITGSATLSIYGGTTSDGTAHQNRVSVENATFATASAGESLNGGDASSNTLSAANVTGQTLSGGLSAVGAAFDNTVNFHSGVIGDGVGGYIYGGNGQSEVYGNTVNIFGGTMGQGVSQPVSATVLGGFGGSINGDIHDNRVNIYAGVIGDSGTQAMVYGGDGGGAGGSVYNNTVTLAGGTVGNGSVTGYIYGGRQSGTAGDAYNNSVIMTGGETDYIYGGLSLNGDALENKIEISGGTVNSWVVGGYTSSAAESSDNTVSLSGTANLVNAELRGWDGAAISHSGNTLQVHEYVGSAVKSIGNFEIYDFLIPTSLANGGAALTVTDASDISNGEIRVAFVDGGSMLQTNDRITLINDEAGLTTTNVIPGAQQIKQGALIVYDFDLLTDPKNLYLRIRSISADPSSKSVSEGRIGSLAFLNQGHDLLVEKGFDAAGAVLGRTGDGWSKPTFFGVVGGGHFRHKTGSHVDVDGVSTLLGLTWRNNGPYGALLLGAFFESGYANYDTRNAFASGTVRGDGDSRYFGGGFLARYDWKSGFYVETTGRVGGVKNKFDSDLTDAFGNRANYDINSTYFGLHAGVGYKWQLNEKVLLDLSTKYLWSRQNSDTAVITGSRVSFDANDSHRWRTGARFTYAVSDCIAPYVGAAFEYEFNGEAKARIHNIRFGVPSLKGGTGVGEIGLTVRRGAFTADLGVQGHIGRRDGITGSLRVGLNF